MFVVKSSSLGMKGQKCALEGWGGEGNTFPGTSTINIPVRKQNKRMN